MRNDLIVALDSEGRFTFANQEVYNHAGYAPEELIGRPFTTMLTAASQDAVLAQFNRLVTGEQETSQCELEAIGKDGSRIPLELQVSAIRDGTGQPVGWLVVGRDVTERKQMEEQSTRLLLLEERERIAMDLHDSVIQSLYAVALNLSAHDRTFDGDTAATRQTLHRAMAQIEGVIQEIRNSIYGLRLPASGAGGLRAGLETLAKELRINVPIQSEIDFAAEVDGLLSPIAIVNLLHFAREATSNVTRHAGATVVRLALTRAGDQLILTVSDNGRGFDRQNPEAQSGQGLRNMMERANILGGRLTIESGPGRGTEVRLEMPLREMEGEVC
ncbi:MAG: PAS domain-containing sensor histidine kinase [Chloroflexi bacterium]|nr:PAS domain-containing sensor histidine kinase [Chloroflexota bacterium]